MTTEQQTILPPPEPLLTVARLPGEPSATGAALSYNQIYYLKNKARIKDAVKAYRLANVDKVSELQKAIYKKNAKQRCEKVRQYRNENKAKISEWKKEYYSLHPEKKKLSDKLWRDSHKELCRSYREKWVQNNKEKKKIQNKAWELSNPAKYKAITKHNAHRRRTRTKDESLSEQKSIKTWICCWVSKKQVRCYWCNSLFDPSDCHVDHIFPICKGGRHNLSNLCISCSFCNQKKNAKSIEEWNKNLSQPVLL